MSIRYVLVVLFAVVLLQPISTPAFEEGVDYKVVAQPQTTDNPGKVEVLELFWYGCPHCYHLETDLQQWRARLPEHVIFQRMPAILGPQWGLHGRAFFAAEVLGVLERIHGPLFAAMHKEHTPLSDENQLADWFANQGVNREEFLKAMHSFVVDMKVRRAQQFDTRMGIDGVPCFIVNGKYLTSPSMTASAGKVFQVIDELIAKEAAALTPAAAPPKP